VLRMSRPGAQAVTAELTPEGETALTAAMDTHFDGVRRLVISWLEPDELATMRRIADRLQDEPA
jgi:hypothetical protein